MSREVSCMYWQTKVVLLCIAGRFKLLCETKHQQRQKLLTAMQQHMQLSHLLVVQVDCMSIRGIGLLMLRLHPLTLALC